MIPNSLENTSNNRIEAFAMSVITLLALCHGINIIPKNMAFALGITALVLVLVFQYRKNRIPIYWIDILWIAWMVIIIFNRDPNYPYLDVAFYTLGFWTMLIFRDNCTSYKGVLKAIVFFSVINIVVCLISLVSRGTFVTIINVLKVSNREVNASQFMTGLANGRSRNGTLLVMGLSVFSSITLSGYKKRRWICLVFAGLSFVLIMCTGKLSHALFSLIVFLSLYLLLEKEISKTLQRLIVFVIVGSLFFALVMELFPQANFLFSKLALKAESGDISTGRLAIWEVAISKFKEAPWFGFGYGSFQMNSLEWTSLTAYAGVHNDYLQWLCETGIVGFTINILIMISSFKLILKELKIVRDKPGMEYEKTLIIWSAFIQLFVILYSFTGIPHYSYDLSVPYFIACAVPIVIRNTLLSNVLKKRPIVVVKL